MKIAMYLILTTLVMSASLVSCQQRKPAEVITTIERIKSADSFAVMHDADSANASDLDPETHATALQQSPPPKQAVQHDCQVSFNAVANPAKNKYIFQVSSFNNESPKCWSALEEHAVKQCGDNAFCDITYLEISDFTRTSVAPHYADATVLKNRGIGYFSMKNKRWELKGARMWDRSGKGFDYYNSNHY